MSSYEKNNYGKVFEVLVEASRPVILVELGVFNGYSTLHIAKGIKLNKERHNLNGHLDSYDLFEDYQYKHGVQAEVETLLFENGLKDYVTVKKGDAYKVASNYEDKSIHFLHVDISNTGKIVRDIMEVWDKKIYQGGYIIFEGGTDERDNIDWMKKYNMEPIRKEIETNPRIQKNYVYGTYMEFPSMTVTLKKFDYA